MIAVDIETNGPREGVGHLTLLAMAAASGAAVANIYYNQPILGIIEHEFGNETIVGLVPMATQLGYALGLFLLLPLGDLVSRHRLILVQFILLALALVLMAMSTTPWVLVGTSLLVGVTSTVAQQIVPFAATLAAPEKRGAAIGTVMSGVLAGILFSRTVSGYIGEHLGWRDVFLFGAPVALLAGLTMFLILPKHAPISKLSYSRALKSLAVIWVKEPSLRQAALTQAALFASFSAFWTILAFYLQSPRFNLGADVAGLFGIVGAVGIFAAPLAGRIADRRGPYPVVCLGALLTLLAWAIFGFWGSLAALIVGVIVLDFGVQSALVSNQHIVLTLGHETRSRINTLFMTSMFLGGAAGSGLASLGWSYAAWPAVSGIGATLALVGIVLFARGARRKVK